MERNEVKKGEGRRDEGADIVIVNFHRYATVQIEPVYICLRFTFDAYIKVFNLNFNHNNILTLEN